jgi:hypothetical protein
MRDGRDFVPGSCGVASQLQALVIPVLRKVREGRGIHCVADASEIKSLGHPLAGYLHFITEQWRVESLGQQPPIWLTVPTHKTRVVVEVDNTFSSFRSPELSQLI